MNIENLRKAANKKHHEQMKVLSRIAPYFDAIYDAVRESDPDINVDAYDLNLSVTGGKKVLERIFAVLRRNGFEPDGRPEGKETNFSTFFRHPDGASIFLRFSSTTCRMVEVGKETIERPIYEVICDDEGTGTTS